MTSKEALIELKKIIGDELYQTVIKELSGTMVYFPANHEWQDKEERNDCLREDYYSGKFEISDLALKYNISISRVYKIIENKK
jgi:Mor family transcriptional regulator